MYKKSSILKILPVLFCFYIVGICDVVGVSASCVQQDFQLSDTVAALLPAMVFAWFLFLAPQAAALMNRLGYKRTILLSMAITLLGMTVPFLMYNLMGCMLAFALLGAGNAVLQFSLNPLLASVATGRALAGSLTSGQIIKAVSSFCGPFMVAFAIGYWGGWHYAFLLLGAITLMAACWLLCTPIEEYGTVTPTSLRHTFSLLKDSRILVWFLATVLVVGVDISMNVLTPKLMMERCGHTVQDAAIGSSVYFAFRTLGAIAGTMLLAGLSEMKYLRMHILLALAAVVMLFFAGGEYLILTMVGVVGFACSTLFGVIYSIVVKSRPDKVNNLSSLMMTGVCGGAILPLLMGLASDCTGSQTGALAVIAVSMLCLVYCTFCRK